MLTIKLDLGNTPSVLAALSDPRNVQLVANAAAESYVDDTLDWIQSGEAFQGRTGQLEQSINWRSARGGVAEVFAQADYANYVEFGTRPHVIEPKPGRKGLKIPVTTGGGFIIRRRINHPGSKPHPFFFADRDNREQHAQERGLLVLAARGLL